MAGSAILPSELDLVPSNPLDVSTGEQQQNFLDWISAMYQLPGAQGAQSVTIASGSITPNRAVVLVDTQGAASTDDLANAAVSSMELGRWLILRAANTARTVVVKHNAGGSGQFLLADGADFALDDTEKCIAFYRSGSDWVETFRAPPAPFDAALIASGTFANARISAPSVRQHFGNGRIQLLDEINVSSASSGLLDVSAWAGSLGKLVVHGFAYLASDALFQMRAQTDASPLASAHYHTVGRSQSVSSGSGDISRLGLTYWDPFANALLDESDAIHFFMESVGYFLSDPSDWPAIFYEVLGRAAVGPRITARGTMLLDGAADPGDSINALQFFSSVNFSALHAEAWLFDAP